MHAAGAATAARQRDVERLLRQARIQFGVGELAASRSSAARSRSLAALMRAPGMRSVLGRSLPSAFSSSVSAPPLPRKRAFAFSSAAGSRGGEHAAARHH